MASPSASRAGGRATAKAAGSKRADAKTAAVADAPVLAPSGKSTKKVSLDQASFGARFQEALVHQCVRAEQAARRRGTASTKTRAQVSGGGAKPWRQKGTGRARAGSSRSPIWTGGGIVFGPSPRSYTFKVNRRELRAAFRSALSLHAQRGSLAVFDAGSFSAPKTTQAADLLDGWIQPQPTLVVLAADESSAALSFRNIARVAVLTPESVGVADLLGASSLLVSESALESLAVRASAPVRDASPAVLAGGRTKAKAATKAADEDDAGADEGEAPETAEPGDKS